MLLFFVFLPPMQAQCPITKAQMNDLWNTATHILEHTEKNIVLAGQSPAYLWPFLKQKRTVYRVAFSGCIYFDEYSVPSQQQQKNYCSYLKIIGLDAAAIKKSDIVDYTRAFYGSTGFVQMLKHCSDQSYFPTLFNLVENNLTAETTSRTTKALPFFHYPVIFHHADAFANNKVPRCMPKYSRGEWNELPSMADPHLELGKECIEHLERFVATHSP